jgi:hypothetical protein
MDRIIFNSPIEYSGDKGVNSASRREPLKYNDGDYLVENLEGSVGQIHR